MNILITGATGYIGRRVVEKLSQHQPQLKILTLNLNEKEAKKLLPYKNCIHSHISNVEIIRNFRAEVVLHLATLSNSRSDTQVIEPMIEANIVYGVKLLDIVTQIDSFKTFINVGSFAEYRLGGTEKKSAYLYTATKSAFRHFVDFYADSYGFNYITAVPYSVYGGIDTAKKLMDYMVDSIGADEPVDMTPGDQVLDFVHVDDVVDFFVSAVLSHHNIHTKGEEYHLGTSVGTKVKHLAKLIEEIHDVKCNINWGGREYRPLDVMCAVAPQYTNKHIIDWSPKITIQEGIKQLITHNS